MKTKIKQFNSLLVAMLLLFNFIGSSTTYACFSDTEILEDNIFTAGNLDFSLNNTEENSLELDASNSAEKIISIDQEGSLGFQYIILAENIDGLLCDDVIIEAKLNGEIRYGGPLNLFVLTIPLTHSGLSDEWIFKMSAVYDAGIVDEVCQFEFGFDAWQENITNYGDGGFSHEDSIVMDLIFKEEEERTETRVVLNEILANPSDNECGLSGIDSEWVEIYNNATTSVDLEGWYLEDNLGVENRIVIVTEVCQNGHSTIEPIGSGGEWLVVFLNGCILNNAGDTIFLYDDSGILIDSYSYGSATENKSDVRYPDGASNWVDGIPTPSEANIEL